MSKSRFAAALLLFLTFGALGGGSNTPVVEANRGQQPDQIVGSRGTVKLAATINFTELARKEKPEALREPKGADELLRGPGDLPVPARFANAGQAAPAATSARPAVQSSTNDKERPVPSSVSPTPISSFPALGDNGVSIPPDTEGAVGPSHLMVTLNSQIEIQNRAGGTISTAALDDFWRPLGSEEAFDPKVIYDPISSRWIIVSLAGDRQPTSSILVGASRTSDPTGSWQVYSIKADSASLLWADYPSVGFNGNWVVISVNMFTLGSSATFQYTKLMALNKSELYAAAPTVHFTFWQDTSGGSTIAPALTYDSTQLTEYLTTTWNGNSNGQGFIRLGSISGPVGSESYTASLAFPSTSSTWAAAGPTADFAPQAGTSAKINTDDSRMIRTLYRNGSIWCTHSVFLPADLPTRSAVQWWQLSSSGGVQQLNRVDDSTGQIFCAYPSIAVNGNNDLLIGYADFSANGYASGAYSFRSGQDPPSTLRDGLILKAGEAKYLKNDGNSNRWGDYSNTQVDPVNDADFWTIQEYAAAPSGGVDRWGTWWGRVSPNASTPTDSTPSVTNLTARLSGDVLTLTGTASDSGSDMTQLDVVVLDASGASLGDTGTFDFPFGSSSLFNFQTGVSGMDAFPSAVKASLTVIDSQGLRSTPVVATFSQADPGGPSVFQASYSSFTEVMVVHGAGFGGSLGLEINGVLVTPIQVKIKGGGTKLKIVGSPQNLNLFSGPNRLVVIVNGRRSNILVLSL